MKRTKRFFKAIYRFFHDAIRMLLYFFFPFLKPPTPPTREIIDIDM